MNRPVVRFRRALDPGNRQVWAAPRGPDGQQPVEAHQHRTSALRVAPGYQGPNTLLFAPRIAWT